MELALCGRKIADLKTKAVALRASREDDGIPTTLTQALDILAKEQGVGDWKTLQERATERVRLSLGDVVNGIYFGEPFRGRVTSLEQIGAGRRIKVTIRFDHSVGTVRIGGVAAYRSQVNMVLHRDGSSVRASSDGVSHLVLESVET